MNDMKEIIVTDSYLELDQNVRACQNDESLHSCSTRLHNAAFLAQCGCVPFHMTQTETPLCSGAQLGCVQNTTVDTSSCLPPCSGLFVTGFSKSEQGTDSFHMDRATLKAYKNYTKWSPFPSELKGRIRLLSQVSTFIPNISILEFEWFNKFRYVRIYFDTPTFDRITKDRAAKFVDMLSAIGGTMGLLTGFSIISGVEILYFLGKIMFNFMRTKENKSS